MKETKKDYPLYSSFELTSFHLSICSSNEGCSLCIRVHLATRGDDCHTAVERSNLAGKSIIIAPKQSEEDNDFFPP